MRWNILDKSMRAYSQRLIDEVKIDCANVDQLVTIIAGEVRSLPQESKRRIRDASPVPVNVRLDELSAFESWMMIANKIQCKPEITRAQIITQNYICFVYLEDACFELISKNAPINSSAAKCTRFLTRGRVRHFRNAVAHGNWMYREDYLAIRYWDKNKKSNKAGESLRKDEVLQEELDFWQALSRCVSYATYTSIDGDVDSHDR